MLSILARPLGWAITKLVEAGRNTRSDGAGVFLWLALLGMFTLIGVLFFAWLWTALYVWDHVMIGLVGAKPISDVAGALLFLAGTFLAGRVAGLAIMLYGITLTLTNSHVATGILDMSLAPPQLIVFGLFLLAFGANYPSWSRKRE